MKRKIELKNVLLALALTTIVFSLGILVGNFSMDKKYEVVASTIADIREKTMSMELEYELLLENPCVIESDFLLSELNQLSERLGYLEGVYGVNDPEINDLKHYYSLLQIKHWMYMAKMKESCNLDANLIIYFYSNNNCNGCNEQGTIITAFRKLNENNTYVYPLDFDIQDASLNTLKKMYNVTSTPSVVFNDRRYSGIVSLKKMEEEAN